jgi:hypothetical protein|tara:strand:- start:2777 stop:3187 length:411 start_codon:yes stop_codon:yes gene_type:complete
MASRQKSRKTYRSMQGKVVDLDMLIKRNELTPAVGNARVNARGDELGPGGKIIRKREEVVKEYYSSGSEPVQHESAAKVEGLSQAEAEELMSLDEEVIPAKPKATVQTRQTTQPKSQPVEDKWIEDDNGNFIQKGE